jgi:hypothetical protein
MASVEVPSGIVVDVDVAEPATIIGIWVPGFDDLADVKRAVDRIRGERHGLFRLALAEDVLAGTMRPSDVALALAELDRALVSLDLAHLFDAREVGRRLRAAVDGVHESADALFEVDHPRAIAEALRTVSRALDPSDDAGGTLLALADALDDVERAGRSEVLEAMEVDAAAMMPPAASPAAPATRAAGAPVSRLLDIVDLDALPDGLLATQVAARATSSSEIEVRIGTPVATGAWWARAHRGDGVIVAVSPVRTAEGGAIARLLVPPADVAGVVVDLTDRPGEPRQGAASRGVVRAVRMGRIAARHERAQRPVQANEGWRRTAGAWQEVGDKRRVAAALERERSRNMGAFGGRPLLSDLPAE